MDKRFLVEFSGKNYPEYRPMSMKIRAASQKRAEEWVEKQLGVWNVDPKIVKASVTEIPEEAAPVDGDKAEKKSKKEAKRKSAPENDQK